MSVGVRGVPIQGNPGGCPGGVPGPKRSGPVLSERSLNFQLIFLGEDFLFSIAGKLGNTP